MNEPLELLMQQAAQAISMFADHSRYRHSDIATGVLPDGRQVSYVRCRFLPRPETMVTQTEHVVKPGDRLDNLAQHFLGHPEVFWQICDANRALRPADLTDEPPELGEPRVIRIGLPPGIPAPRQS